MPRDHWFVRWLAVVAYELPFFFHLPTISCALTSLSYSKGTTHQWCTSPYQLSRDPWECPKKSTRHSANFPPLKIMNRMEWTVSKIVFYRRVCCVVESKEKTWNKCETFFFSFSVGPYFLGWSRYSTASPVFMCMARLSDWAELTLWIWGWIGKDHWKELVIFQSLMRANIRLRLWVWGIYI